MHAWCYISEDEVPDFKKCPEGLQSRIQKSLQWKCKRLLRGKKRKDSLGWDGKKGWKDRERRLRRGDIRTHPWETTRIWTDRDG